MQDMGYKGDSSDNDNSLIYKDSKGVLNHK